MEPKCGFTLKYVAASMKINNGTYIFWNTTTYTIKLVYYTARKHAREALVIIYDDERKKRRGNKNKRRKECDHIHVYCIWRHMVYLVFSIIKYLFTSISHLMVNHKEQTKSILLLFIMQFQNALITLVLPYL